MARLRPLFLASDAAQYITAYICELLVVPAWRGHGLGRLLIAVCHALQPTVRFDLLSTEEADGFYEHLDFLPFKGYRKSYI